MKVYLIFLVFCLGICNGLPHIREDKIKVEVIQDETIESVSSQTAEMLSNVKQILDEMDKTTISPSLVQTVTQVVQTIYQPVPSNTDNRKTKRPPKEKPKKERPLIAAYIDLLSQSQTATAAPVAADPATPASPSFGTYITNIEKLQIGLTGMASDIDVMCDDKKPAGLDPLRNPFIQFLQNITQQQSDLTNTVLQYWSSAPGLALQPLTLPTLKPIALPTLPSLFRSIDQATSSKESVNEVDEKLKGLEEAIKKSIKEMLPYMNYIEQFPGEDASTEEWEKFNKAIEFVAARLRNKTIQQVLDKEKTKNLLENYDKYLNAVQYVKLLTEVESGKEESKEALMDAIKTRKGC